MSATGEVVVIGLGVVDRGDDGAGLDVARRLERRRLPEGTRVLRERGGAASLMDAWSGAGLVIVVDAACSGEAPGRVRRFNASTMRHRLSRGGASSHDLGLAEAIALADALGTLPDRVIVYTIEGACFEPGAPLTPAVRDAAADVARRIAAELRGLAVTGARSSGAPARCA